MIRYTLVNQETGATSGFPTNAAGVKNIGVNIPGGNLESIILRLKGTITAANVKADLPQTISSLRCILNGTTFFDYRSGYNDPANDTTASQLGYFMNSIGQNLSSEDCASTTAREAFLRIPCGIGAPSGVSRIEIALGTVALANASSNQLVEVWCVYNDSMQTRTTVAAATSFISGGSGEELVTVRVPSNVPGLIAGVLIQNERDQDDFTGVRIVSQSEFSLSTTYLRYLNSDLQNGVQFAAPLTGLGEQQFAQQSPGTVFLPLFGLQRNGDVILQVTTTSSRTLLFSPVIVAGANASDAKMAQQSQAVPTNTLNAVLDRSGAADA